MSKYINKPRGGCKRNLVLARPASSRQSLRCVYVIRCNTLSHDISAQKSVCSGSDGGWSELVFTFPQALRDEDMKDIKALMMHDPHLVNGTLLGVIISDRRAWENQSGWSAWSDDRVKNTKHSPDSDYWCLNSWKYFWKTLVFFQDNISDEFWFLKRRFS